MEDSVVAVTDVMHSCRCCLRCAPDRDLKTPYTYLGTTEIYSDMLRECFDLQLEVGSNGSCGICSACVGRLRDARDFKLQVQRSQEELQARLQGDLILEGVKLEVKSEDDEDEICFVLYEDPVVKLEVDNDEPGEVVLQDPLFESKPADDVTKDEDSSASEKKRYSCNQCTRSYTQNAKLKIHQKQHTGVKDHICEVCGAGFYNQKSLVRHNLIHKGERPYPCTLCNKRFIARCDLNRHLRIHSGYKPFKCATCTMSFNAKHQLQNHERMHTGERPYTCEVCNVCFSYKVNLNNHVYKVHGINLKFKSIHIVTEEVLRRELGLAGEARDAIAHILPTLDQQQQQVQVEYSH